MRTKLILATAAAATALSTAAFAADLPRRAAPPVFTPVPPVFTWTGFFIGTESTYTWTDRQRITTTGLSPANVTALAAGVRAPVLRSESDGFGKVGGGAGYNYQFTPGSGFVVGVAANVDWTDVTKRTGFVGNAGGVTQYRQTLDYLGTVTGRLGYAFDRFLVYGTGGFAFGGVDTRAIFATNTGSVLYLGRNDSTQTGYAYGGGIEYAIPADSFLARFNLLSFVGIQSAAVTLKAEYLHYDLGRRNLAIANVNPAIASGAGYVSRFSTEGNIVRAGLNYKFNGF